MLEIRLTIREKPLRFPPQLDNDLGLKKWIDPTGREFGFRLHREGRYWMTIYNFGTFVVEPGGYEAEGFPEDGVEPGRFREVFFHLVAPWMMQRQDWECLHASAVLTEAGVVAFCGPAGRGKSTLARACQERGALPYADDAVPFLIRDGRVIAARMPQRSRLREPAASWFPTSMTPKLNGSDSREMVYDFEPTLRPLAAIYWLEPMEEAAGGGVPRIERIPAAESFQLLLGEAYCLTLADRNCNRKMVRNYLSLASRTPVFRLSFSPGREGITLLLDRLEQNQRTISHA